MVQVESGLECAWFQRLKLKYDKLLPGLFAFKFNLRPQNKALKGVRVMKLHFPGQKRKATVKGLSRRPASEVELTAN